MPMRTIGMLLGIPEQDQEAIRDRIDEGLHSKRARCPGSTYERRGLSQHEMFAEYIDWRRRAPLRRPDDRAAHGRVRGRDRDDRAG